MTPSTHLLQLAEHGGPEQEPALCAAPRTPPPGWGTDFGFGGQPKALFTEREASVSRATPRVPLLAGPRLEGSRCHQPPTHVGLSRAWLPFCPHWRKNGPSCEKPSLSQPNVLSEERTRSGTVSLGSRQVPGKRPRVQAPLAAGRTLRRVPVRCQAVSSNPASRQRAGRSFPSVLWVRPLLRTGGPTGTPVEVPQCPGLTYSPGTPTSKFFTTIFVEAGTPHWHSQPTCPAGLGQVFS